MRRFAPDPLQNIPGRAQTQRTAAGPLSAPLDAVQEFLHRSPPSTLANRVQLLQQAAAWQQNSQAQGVLRCTLPFPMALGLNISAHLPFQARYPLPLRLPFYLTYRVAGVEQRRTACIFVEWGHGQYRDALWLDLGQHTLRLPVCTWIAVSAYAGNLDGFTPGQLVADVSAALILSSNVDPDARFTHSLEADGNEPGALSVGGITPPFARRATISGYSTHGANRAIITQGDPYANAFAQYDFPLSAAGNPTPQSTSPQRIPVPSTTTYQVAFSGATPVDQFDRAQITFEVSP